MPGLDYDVLKDGFTIKGKRVVVIFLFKHYWRRYLQSDYDDLKKYHRKNASISNPSVEIDLKFYHELERFPSIPYDYFKETIRRFLLRVIYEVLRDNPGIVTTTTDTFEIQLRVARNENREWYGSYEDDISDTEHAYLQYNGLWLLNTVVLPWIAYKKIDYKLLYKFFQHELSHHKDLINQRYFVEDYVKQRIRPMAKRLGNYSLFFLYLAFESLRVEGLHEFSDKRYMQRIPVNMEWVRNFRVVLENLVKIRQMGAAEQYYENNLGTMSRQGVYYVGRFASQTIALAVAKKEGFTSLISVKLPTGKDEPLSELNAVMNVYGTFYLTPIPVQVFEKAVPMIERTNYREFIRMYEWACNELDIEENNRIVTYTWFDDLKKRATNWYEAGRLQMVKAKEYLPTEYAEHMPESV